MKKILTYSDFVNELNFVKVHKMEPIENIVQYLKAGDTIEITQTEDEDPVEVTVIKIQKDEIAFIPNIYKKSIFSGHRIVKVWKKHFDYGPETQYSLYAYRATPSGNIQKEENFKFRD